MKTLNVIEFVFCFQALVVRKFKDDGADKSVWQPEVNKLLALKSQLAAVSGISVPSGTQKSRKSKKWFDVNDYIKAVLLK